VKRSRSKEAVALSLAILVVGLSLLLAACGGSGNSNSTGESESSSTAQSGGSGGEGTGGSEAGGVDVGTGKPIPLNASELKVAYVPAALSTPETQNAKEGIEKVASEAGIKVEIFDPGFDPAKQYALYQNVIDSGKFNALVTLPLAGEQSCEILSKTAPEKGIAVSVFSLPICGREFEAAKGNGLWAPGTVATVGIITNNEGLEAWANSCEKETGGGETILINGAAGSPNFKQMTQAFEKTNMKVVADYATLYETSEALEKTSAALAAHPNLKVVVAQAPPLTQGVIQALKAAGKTPGVDVKVCSFDGGGQEMIERVKAGEVAVDAYANNEWIASAALQSIIEAAEGHQIPRVIVPGEDGKIEKSGSAPWPPTYTKETADQYTPTGA